MMKYLYLSLFLLLFSCKNKVRNVDENISHSDKFTVAVEPSPIAENDEVVKVKYESKIDSLKSITRSNVLEKEGKEIKDFSQMNYNLVQETRSKIVDEVVRLFVATDKALAFADECMYYPSQIEDKELLRESIEDSIYHRDLLKEVKKYQAYAISDEINHLDLLLYVKEYKALISELNILCVRPEYDYAREEVEL